MNTFTDLPLELLDTRLAVCRLPVGVAFPDWALASDFVSLTRTRTELSIVCEERLVPLEIIAEHNWRALRVQGELDFALVGVLDAIAAPLAQAGVSIFALSTYDTDYILIKESSLERALMALQQVGFMVV